VSVFFLLSQRSPPHRECVFLALSAQGPSPSWFDFPFLHFRGSFSAFFWILRSTLSHLPPGVLESSVSLAAEHIPPTGYCGTPGRSAFPLYLSRFSPYSETRGSFRGRFLFCFFEDREDLFLSQELTRELGLTLFPSSFI